MFRFDVGWPGLLMLGLVALLLFGKRIPEVMNALGRGVQEFLDWLQGLESPPQRGRDVDENQEPVLRTLPPALLIAFGVLAFLAVILEYLRV